MSSKAGKMANLIGQRLGQYEIIALLGKGGMATVYQARQLNIKRDVAVKVIRPDLVETGDFIQRFQRESETIAALSHPHILKLFDYGRSGDLLYLVMELLPGGSLADRMRQGALAVPVAIALADQIASALDYAHKRGIVHRDLKPQNILLDDNGNAFLTDFGIAKLLNEKTVLTQTGMALGTPAYMAPEQWQGQPVDARTDVYALGIILFEMLLGKLPFQADTPFSMMHKHINENPPSIARLRNGIPAQVDSIIAKALSKSPQDRFASASGLVAAFKASLNEPQAQTPVALSATDAMTTIGETTVLPQSQGFVHQTSPSAQKWNAPSLLVLAIPLLVVIAAIILLVSSALTAPRQGLLQPAASATVDCHVQNQTLSALQTAISQSTLDSANYQATFAAIRHELTLTPQH